MLPNSASANRLAACVGAVEDVGRRLVDRRGASLRHRVGLGAGVDLLGLEAPVLGCGHVRAPCGYVDRRRRTLRPASRVRYAASCRQRDGKCDVTPGGRSACGAGSAHAIVVALRPWDATCSGDGSQFGDRRGDGARAPRDRLGCRRRRATGRPAAARSRRRPEPWRSRPTSPAQEDVDALTAWLAETGPVHALVHVAGGARGTDRVEDAQAGRLAVDVRRQRPVRAAAGRGAPAAAARGRRIRRARRHALRDLDRGLGRLPRRRRATTPRRRPRR